MEKIVYSYFLRWKKYIFSGAFNLIEKLTYNSYKIHSMVDAMIYDIF
jgi:hypothetical protein